MTDPGRLDLPRRRPVVEEAALVRARARRRIRVVGGVLALLMAGVAARGVHLSVEPDARTRALAVEKRWSSVTVQGERGAIVDADAHVLAKSVQHPAVFVDPEAIREQEGAPWGWTAPRIVEALARILDLPRDQVAEAVSGKGRYQRLAKGVHPEVAERLRDEGLDRHGVIIQPNFRRFYPQGTFASQMLGFVDEAGKGQQGLEYAFHTDLAGGEIVSEHRINRWGRVLELWSRDVEVARGHTLHTTIDFEIQRAAEHALADVVARHQPASATAIVVEVATGRILAIATAPAFNPNDVRSLQPEDYARTKNLAVVAAVEPGSVIKPFTMAAALEAGAATPRTVLETPSPYAMYGIRIHDDHPHPRVTVAEMVKVSSNVGAAKLAAKMGPDALMRTFEGFGFGEVTGIDTQGEARGARRPRAHFGPVELATVSFGQGLTTTPLQLAMATAAIANRGVRMRPILVDRITDVDGQLVRSWEPMVVQRVISPETASAVSAAMELVLEDGGTGTKGRVPGFRVAGKTGTAEKAKGGRYTAARIGSFIGFAPADRPDVAVVVMVDEPTVGSRYGGVVAAPAFAEITAAALRRRGVHPDPGLLPPSAVEGAALLAAEEAPPLGPVEVRWQGDAWAMPDLRGRSVRDVLAGLQGTALRVQVEGSGVVAAQDPPAGAPVAPGAQVALRFQ